MNKLAEVVYAYSPKNEDELELTVGDKIEVIGYEEEGWWKGKLKGQVGVFPSNFVVIEQQPSSLQQQHIATSNKLNSIFGSKLGSKSSLSSNSSITANSTSNNSLNTHNNNNNNNNNNSSNNGGPTTMSGSNNNTHHHQISSSDSNRDQQGLNTSDPMNDESNNNSFGERRPKPIRGVGFGDIFAAGAKTKPSQTVKAVQEATAAAVATGGIVASERLGVCGGVTRICGTLQKPIPKKPPPPTPSGNVESDMINAQNGSSHAPSSDQAPALPPKPSNQAFSPFTHQSRMLPSHQSLSSLQSTPKPGMIREQVRVIHAYPKNNPDELTLKVDDIINVIDKKSEDVGWWRGELNGEIGLFPDNFVEIIAPQKEQPPIPTPITKPSNEPEWMSRPGFRPFPSTHSSTHLDFGKELENNLEKHNSPISSLKRDKQQNQQSAGPSRASTDSNSTSNTNSTHMNMGFIAQQNDTTITSTNLTSNGHSSSSTTINTQDSNQSPTKLNHITANRPTGPIRRPPTSTINRRNQVVSDPYGSFKKDPPIVSSNDGSREEQPSVVGSFQQSTTRSTPTKSISSVGTNQEPPSESVGQIRSSQTSQLKPTPAAPTGADPTGPVSGSPFTSAAPTTNGTPPISVRPSLINHNSVDNNSSTINNGTTSSSSSAPIAAQPKVSQRASSQQQPILSDNGKLKSGQKTPTSATGSPPTPTPSWMVDLRVKNAGKKRDPPVTTSSMVPSIQTLSETITSSPTVVSTSTAIVPGNNSTSIGNATTHKQTNDTVVTNNGHKLTSDTQQAQNQQHQIKASHDQAQTVSPNKMPTKVKSNQSTDSISIVQFNETIAKYDNMFKQISKDVNDELAGLRKDFKRLQDDLKGINELKSAMDMIKVELKACQNATENQKECIKELLNLLADEKRKMLAMQDKLDKNLG